MKSVKKEQKQDIASLAKMKDSDTDLTEMPKVLDWSKAQVGKFYPGGKKIVPARKKPREKEIGGLVLVY